MFLLFSFSYSITNNPSRNNGNDVYTEAAKILYKDSLKGKYDGYGSGVISLILEITGSENHELTQSERQQISDVFSGLAWNLSK